MKHRPHFVPLVRHRQYLSNEGLGALVLDGVLMVGPIRGPIGEAND